MLARSVAQAAPEALRAAVDQPRHTARVHHHASVVCSVPVCACASVRAVCGPEVWTRQFTERWRCHRYVRDSIHSFENRTLILPLLPF